MGSDLPDGWVWISDYDTRQPGDFGKTGPSGKYASIQRHIRKHPSKIRHYKDGKCIAANKADIEKFLAARDKQAKRLAKAPSASSRKPAADDSAIASTVILARLDNGIALINAKLERIATAIESIATQPQTPRQDLSDRNQNERDAT
jgi:hypothetical protein